LLACSLARLLAFSIARLLACSLACLLTHSLTHSLTPCSRVLLEKLNGLQLIKKFTAFYGTRKFINGFPILSQINPVHTPPSTSWNSILILSLNLHLVSKVVNFFHVFPPKHCVCLFSHKCVLHVSPILFLSILSPEWYLLSSTDHTI
jgi:hypothetical protein